MEKNSVSKRQEEGNNIEDQNVIIFLDKIRKNLEMNMVPQTIINIEVLETELKRSMSRKKGKLFLPITIPPPTETERSNPIFMREFEMAHKINEVVIFLNERFPVV